MNNINTAASFALSIRPASVSLDYVAEGEAVGDLPPAPAGTFWLKLSPPPVDPATAPPPRFGLFRTAALAEEAVRWRAIEALKIRSLDIERAGYTNPFGRVAQLPRLEELRKELLEAEEAEMVGPPVPPYHSWMVGGRLYCY